MICCLPTQIQMEKSHQSGVHSALEHMDIMWAFKIKFQEAECKRQHKYIPVKFQNTKKKDLKRLLKETELTI